MARTRYLKPGFFANDRLAEFSPWHRLLFAGLWTLADSAGRLEDRPKRIKGALFPFDNVDVDALLSDLSQGDDPFVVRYQVDGVRYLAVPKFLNHQRPHGKEPASTIPSPNFTKTGAKTQSRGKDVTSPTNSASSPTLTLYGEPYMGNGERGTGNPEPPQDAAAAPVPMRRRSAPLIGSPLDHGKCYPSNACARGLCVPGWLPRREWLPQVNGDDAYVQQFVTAVLAAAPAGPIGDDPLAWWRAQWKMRHGTVVATTKAARTMAAGARLDAFLDAGGELDPFGTKADERKRLERWAEEDRQKALTGGAA